MKEEAARLAIIIEKLEKNGFFIDRSFSLNAQELQTLYLARSGQKSLGHNSWATLANIEDYRQRNREFFDELTDSARPFFLPQDFQEFQKLYGGLSLTKGNVFHIEIYGCGLSAMESYQALQDPELAGTVELGRVPYLPIGYLFLHDEKEQRRFRRDFVLALEGAVGAGHVYEVEVVGEKGVVGDLTEAQGLPFRAKSLAPSFTEWLELMLETQGQFGHNY